MYVKFPPPQRLTCVPEIVPGLAGVVPMPAAIVPEVAALHAWLSATVKLYAPALLVNAPVPVYGVVPPDAPTVTVVVPPTHAIVPADEDAVSTAGCVTVIPVAL